MNVHILNGDCLADTFRQSKIQGELIICRECLIDGPCEAENLGQFWALRAAYIAQTYGDETGRYPQIVRDELEKILQIPRDAAVYLWFEDDLFCQANMWFVLSLIAQVVPAQQIYRVFPINTAVEHWRGFGTATPESLVENLAQRVAFTAADLDLGLRLWEAYRKQDLARLRSLFSTPSACFRYLPEVCQAHLDRFPASGELGLPERLVWRILQEQTRDFSQLFTLFWQQAGIYGFGDHQVRAMYDRLLPLLPQSDSRV
jgi:hypothetical protein